MISARTHDLRIMQRVLQEAVQRFAGDPAAAVASVVDNHGLTHEDAVAWFESVRLSGAPVVSEAALERALSAMRQVQVRQSEPT